MPGLLDVATSTQTVPINGVDVPVYGVSAKGLVVLFERFPIFREMFAGRTPEVTPQMITQMVPEAIATIIAAGTGHPGDVKAEEIADRLPAHDQMELLESILKLTMPKGAGPFVEKLMALVNAMGVESMNIPAMNSPQQSSP